MQEQLQELRSEIKEGIKSEMTAMRTRLTAAMKKEIAAAIKTEMAALSEQITKAIQQKATASCCCPWS